MSPVKLLNLLKEFVENYPSARVVTEEIGTEITGIEYDSDNNEIVIQTDLSDEE